MKKYWALLLVMLGGLLLRFYHNLDISLWHDEAFSALSIRYPWGEMWYRLGLDVHPPLYYIALRLWHYVFGDTLLSLRGFSVFFGTLTIPAVFWFVKESFRSEKIALWAAILVAINPFELQFVTEARMYTFGAFFAVLAAYFLVKALRQQKQWYEDAKLNMPNLPQGIALQKSYIINYACFVLCVGIIDLTHYYLLFTAAALCLYALVYHVVHYRSQFKRYMVLVGAYVLIIISFIPWLKQFLFQVTQVSAGYWIPDISWWSIPSTLWTILLGFANDTSKSSTQKLLLLVTLFTIGLFYWIIKKIDQFEKWLLLFAFVMPFVGSVLFYLKSLHCGPVLDAVGFSHSECHGRSVYQDRYFLYAAMFYSVALALWLSHIKTKGIGVMLFGLYMVVNFAAIYNFWSGLNLSSKPGMSGAAQFLGANVEPGHHVFIGTSYEFFNYKYYNSTYYHTPSTPRLFTGGRNDVSQISHVEGVALLSNQDLLPDFKAATKPGETVWLLWTYAFGSNKPEIPASWTQIDEKEYPDVRPYVGTMIYVTEYKVN